MKKFFCFLALLLPLACWAQCPTGDVNLTTQAEVNSFAADHLGCSTLVSGDLYIEGADITDLTPLSVITEVGGALTVAYNPVLPNLDGLENLVSVVDGIGIYTNDLLTNVHGLTGLTVAHGYVEIYENPLLISLAGMEHFITFEDGLDVYDCPLLVNLTGLSSVETIVGDFYVGDNLALTSFEGLTKLTSVGGLFIYNNPALTTLSDLTLLTSSPGAIAIDNNDLLVNLNGLENIVGTTERMEIVGHAELTDLTALNITSVTTYVQINSNNKLTKLFDNVTSIGGNLDININASLVNLNGLQNLVSVGGKIQIGTNNILTSLEGLTGLTVANGRMYIINNLLLTSLAGMEHFTLFNNDLYINQNPELVDLSSLSHEIEIRGQLWIYDNLNLKSCAVSAVCANLKNNPASTIILANAEGCNNNEEVEAACAAMPVTLVDFVARKKENTVYIRWSTSSEVNSSRFEIQHSDNRGQSWKILGEVQASRESFEAKQYDFTHLAPSKGENLYRLKMIDQDETFAFSRIRSVSMDQVNAFYVYPNPVADQLTVETGNTTPAKILIYNTAGKLLVSKEVKSSGNFYQVETASLHAGIYTIQVTDGSGKKEVHKFIKLPK